jgi:hypothetical protein
MNFKFRKKAQKSIVTAIIPLHHGFDPLRYVNHQSDESDIEMEDLSNQLSSILLKDEQMLLNKTGRGPNLKPRWPITNTRDQHGDNDVFIARANNPFGHSTKWKYR